MRRLGTNRLGKVDGSGNVDCEEFFRMLVSIWNERNGPQVNACIGLELVDEREQCFALAEVGRAVAREVSGGHHVGCGDCVAVRLKFTDEVPTDEARSARDQYAFESLGG